MVKNIFRKRKNFFHRTPLQEIFGLGGGGGLGPSAYGPESNQIIITNSGSNIIKYSNLIKYARECFIC